MYVSSVIPDMFFRAGVNLSFSTAVDAAKYSAMVAAPTVHYWSPPRSFLILAHRKRYILRLLCSEYANPAMMKLLLMLPANCALPEIRVLKVSWSISTVLLFLDM